MVTHRTTDQHDVSVTYFVQPQVQSGVFDSDTGCCKVQTAAFAPSQHLGIASYDFDASLFGGIGKTDDDAFELCDFQAFFDEGIQAKVFWDGARNCEVIYRSVYGQRADVTAWKFQWLNGKTVRAENDFSPVQCDACCIDLYVKFVIGKVSGEQFFD